jgi:6-phosphofructokinase 1
MLSERRLAYDAGEALDTNIERLGPPELDNPVSEQMLGVFRPDDSRRAVLADMDYINLFASSGRQVPGFIEAGPRRKLYFDPRSARAAIVTSGGIAPGLNRVIHSIVQRHYNVYGCDINAGGAVYGVYDGISGLVADNLDMEPLVPYATESYLDHGGSMLGSRRHFKAGLEEQARQVVQNLRKERINILYVIGGDGSLRAANAVAKLVPDISIIGVPKTMDNDILWVAQSFGFSTSVEKATEIIRTLQTEAQSTRRVGIVELFGAESGFVAANAAHAFGHATLVLIPEMFATLQTAEEIEAALLACLEHVRQKMASMQRGSGIIVIAEGVSELLWQRKVKLDGKEPIRDRFAYQMQDWFRERLKDGRGREVSTFVNRPRHHIRAIPPNAFDQTYCDRLGALAAEAGLAGYTRCIVSYWLSEFVLVPLGLITQAAKRVTTTGMFWKQIVLTTGQPDIMPKQG